MPGDDESMNDEAIWETLPIIKQFRIYAGKVIHLLLSKLKIRKACCEICEDEEVRRSCLQDEELPIDSWGKPQPIKFEGGYLPMAGRVPLLSEGQGHMLKDSITAHVSNDWTSRMSIHTQPSNILPQSTTLMPHLNHKPTLLGSANNISNEDVYK
ncbi:hypothetical protein ACFE04_001416 [Oxalis oulophora]